MKNFSLPPILPQNYKLFYLTMGVFRTDQPAIFDARDMHV